MFAEDEAVKILEDCTTHPRVAKAYRQEPSPHPTTSHGPAFPFQLLNLYSYDAPGSFQGPFISQNITNRKVKLSY